MALTDHQKSILRRLQRTSTSLAEIHKDLRLQNCGIRQFDFTNSPVLANCTDSCQSILEMIHDIVYQKETDYEEITRRI